jgi:hypothetical protein
MFNTFFISFQNRTAYEVSAEILYSQPDNVIWRMRIAFWITKVTDMHSEYLILRILLIHSNICYENAFQCYIYTYITCFVTYVVATTTIYGLEIYSHMIYPTNL